MSFHDSIRYRLLAISVVAVLFGATFSACSRQNQVPTNGFDDRSTVILFENDVHCAIDGYAKVAGLYYAIADTANVFLVSSGDYLQGSMAGAISKGQYVVDIMKAMPYAAVTLGNHEFDYKIPRLRELSMYLPYPVVCANLFHLKDNKQVFSPYMIKRFGKKRIAFVGVTTPSTMESERFAFYSDDGVQQYSLMPEKTYSLVQQAVDKARSQGANYVVVLSHLGEDPTKENVDSHGLVANTRGIDIVFDGHTHSLRPADTVLNLDGKPVNISQTGSEFANIGKLLITLDGRVNVTMIPVSEIKESNALVAKATEKVKKQMEEVTARVVCHSDYVLRILDDADEYLVRYAETNAGDIVADAFRDATGADIALTNGGGLRNQPKAGDLTYGDFIQLLPYDNYLTVVEVKGSTIVELLRRNTAKMSYDNGNFPQCSGIRYTIRTGVHKITNVEVLNANGTYSPIDPNRTYTLATIDYCVGGGGFDRVLENCKVIRKTNIHYRDALVDYVEKTLKGKIDIRYAKPQGRITVVEK